MAGFRCGCGCPVYGRAATLGSGTNRFCCGLWLRFCNRSTRLRSQKLARQLSCLHMVVHSASACVCWSQPSPVMGCIARYPNFQRSDCIFELLDPRGEYGKSGKLNGICGTRGQDKETGGDARLNLTCWHSELQPPFLAQPHTHYKTYINRWCHIVSSISEVGTRFECC